MGFAMVYHITGIIKGSWEAIFRVTDDFYLMKGGVRLHLMTFT